MSPAGLRRAGRVLAVAAALAGFAGPAVGREIRATLLHTANLDGQVLSLRYRQHAEHYAGMLRVATLVRRLREAAGAVLLVDCGGLVPGSAESEVSGGMLPLAALAGIGYDLRLPSLDEWCGPGPGLDPAGVAGAVPYLAAREAPAWTVLTCGGIRFGFAGVADGTPPAPCAHPPPDPDDTLRKALAALRQQGPDVLVLLYHAAGDGARERARALCRRFPDFDLALLGGGRTALREERVGSTILAEAGRQGEWLGRVDVAVDTVAGRVVSLQSDLVAVSAEVDEDPGLRSQLGPALSRVRRQLVEVVGYTTGDIGSDAKWPGQSEMTHLVAAGVVERGELVLLAREPGGMLAEGAIEYRDILRAVPRIGDWAEIRVTPPELRRILEENLGLLEDRRFLGAAGFTYQAAPGAPPGERIRELRLANGDRPHGRARLAVRFPADLVQDPARAAERPVLRAIATQPEARLTRLGIDTRERVIKYLRRHSPVTVRPSRTLVVLPDAP